MLVYGSNEYYEQVSMMGAEAVQEEMAFQKQMRAMKRAPAAPWYETVFKGLTGALEVYGKGLKLESQRDMQKIQAEVARMRIQQGMSGAVGPTAGGLNWLSILAFGGVGLLVLLMFKS